MDFLYWTKKDLPDEVLAQMLYGSSSFGVYKRSEPSDSHTELPSKIEQIGLARMITDGATFGYLSDVYVLPAYQGKGLGKWLIDCVVEIFSPKTMPYLRRTMLLTGDKHVEEMYGKAFGMKVVGHEKRPEFGKDLVFMCGRPNAAPESG
ncbi:Acyl-CoA N-acyltransferase [Penicillium chermesinum]|nr:Acyl-CoA N-acyltransferase [Penicillium chermesinum]